MEPDRTDSSGRGGLAGERVRRRRTDTLRLHEVIAAAVDPTTALSVGVKAVTQMGGLGTFADPRLPLTVTNGTVDLVSDKLPALQAYQLSLAAPVAPAGSFDAAAAARGKVIFDGKGECATCHTGPLFTDANTRLHPPGDSVVEPETPSHASRSATRMYRTTPLRGLWQHAPYFHDGSAATLEDVGTRYNAERALGLTAQEIADLAQYLKSL